MLSLALLHLREQNASEKDGKQLDQVGETYKTWLDRKR